MSEPEETPFVLYGEGIASQALGAGLKVRETGGFGDNLKVMEQYSLSLNTLIQRACDASMQQALSTEYVQSCSVSKLEVFGGRIGPRGRL